jgi:hypothetical protein
MQNKEKVIIANCSGFYGDRFSAAREMVEGGHIDFLTGDYLAELTMAILFAKKMKNPNKGYVETFLAQMNQIMKTCADKGIKVVSNAGGLNPKGLFDELFKIAQKLENPPKIAYIEGDNLLPRIKKLQEKGEKFTHLDKGIELKDEKQMIVSANAYLGCWGVVEALNNGADIVVAGRVADAALVAGPAAWKFGWQKNDWDKLAGAYAAGHIIECGAQATGGNYSFLDEISSFDNIGFPIAEVFKDGSSVITKHSETGGIVSVGTVTAQLLYEIREPEYLTPDVISDFGALEITQEDKDRVFISNSKGEPPTLNSKVCINIMGGYKNQMTVLLAGLDIEKKAKIVETALFNSLGGKNKFYDVNTELLETNKENPSRNEEALAYLRMSVLSHDKKLAKAFSSKLVELALSNISGFNLTTPPTKPTIAVKHWPALVSSGYINQKVFIDNKKITVEAIQGRNIEYNDKIDDISVVKMSHEKMVNITFGKLFGARSGDKGGNANLGIWAKSDKAFLFLKDFLSIEKLKELTPDTAKYEIERYELPNLLALNFYIKGILGDGVACSLKIDGQAKTLGEYIRMKTIKAPAFVG